MGGNGEAPASLIREPDQKVQALSGEAGSTSATTADLSARVLKVPAGRGACG